MRPFSTQLIQCSGNVSSLLGREVLLKVTEHIIIDRPIQVVFDYLAQPESAMKWQSSVIGSEKLTDGPPSVNMKAKVVQTLAGQEVTLSSERHHIYPTVSWHSLLNPVQLISMDWLSAKS